MVSPPPSALNRALTSPPTSHTHPTGTFTHSLTHQSTESILLILCCQLLINTALQGIGCFQYLRVLVILFNLFNISLMASRYEPGQQCPSRLGRCHHTLKQKDKGTLPVRHSSEHPIPFLLLRGSVLPLGGIRTLGEPRSQPLTSVPDEEQGSAEHQESSSLRHGAGGRCSLLTWSPFILVLVLTPRDCVTCFLFSGDMPGHSVKVPGTAQKELCVLARC